MVWSTSPLDVNKDITFDLFKIEPFILSWFQSLAQPFTQRWPGKTGERQKDSSFFHTFDPLAKVLQKRSEILVLLKACSRPPPSLAWVCAVSSQLVSWLPLCAHTLLAFPPRSPRDSFKTSETAWWVTFLLKFSSDRHYIWNKMQ